MSLRRSVKGLRWDGKSYWMKWGVYATKGEAEREASRLGRGVKKAVKVRKERGKFVVWFRYITKRKRNTKVSQ